MIDVVGSFGSPFDVDTDNFRDGEEKEVMSSRGALRSVSIVMKRTERLDA